MKNTRRLWIAVLTAAILLTMCSVTAFAADSAGGREESLVSQSQAAGEGVPEEKEIEIDFFDDLETDSGLKDSLFLTGSILAFAGAAGFLCMFLWRRTNKNRDRSQETRDDILDEIEQAEQRNRKQKARGKKEEAALQPEKTEDLFDTQENDFFAAKPVEIAQETPIVPSTPVSMQPNEKPRPRVQVNNPAQPVQPIAVKPVQPVESAEEKQPAAVQPAERPAAEAEPVKSSKYDLDDILREIREGKL